MKFMWKFDLLIMTLRTNKKHKVTKKPTKYFIVIHLINGDQYISTMTYFRLVTVV